MPREKKDPTPCSADSCNKDSKARGMCGTHYAAWWKAQPKDFRTYRTGRPRLATVTYEGMHSRLEINMGRAAENSCVDCGNPANDWTWSNECDETLWGIAKKGRPNLNPYCMHYEHYAPRCTKCHMIFDKVISKQKELVTVGEDISE